MHLGNAHHLHDQRLRCYLLHQSSELIIHTLELIILVSQLRLYVTRTEEDALQVHPTALNINPCVEGELHLLELLIPLPYIRLEGLVVRGHLHGGEVLEILIQLSEEVVPASDQLAFALVLCQFQFEYFPIGLHLPNHTLQHQLSCGYSHELSHLCLNLHGIRLP